MTSINEAAANGGILKGTLGAGIDTLSQGFQLTFVKYVKVILPLDGFVFWVRASLLSGTAQFNAFQFNSVQLNQAKTVVKGANLVTVKGSLHHSILNRQDEDQAVAVNHMIFTTETEIADLNSVSPTVMYIATIDGERFSFSERRAFYKQAEVYHYEGDAIYPTMETQIIDSVEALDFRNVIVSNSLPIWLTLNKFMPVYPSYLIPDNSEPPFASVHIDPRQTRPLQMAPAIDRYSNHWQLAEDTVNITIFGLRNFNVLDYIDYVYQYMLDTDVMGLTAAAVPQDDKQWQTEISVLAMKKTIEFKVSYNQVRIRDVLRQFITSCVPRYKIGGPKEAMIFGYDVALPYEGPFGLGEQLPAVLFMNTTRIARGIAATDSTGDFVFDFYQGYPDQGGQVVMTVSGTAGDHYPQVSFPLGPVSFYINQVLVPVVVSTDPNLLDLTITFGDVPYTWPN